MFDYTHYVPVLRSKTAEWDALGKLGTTEKRAITPLIKVTPDALTADNKTIEQKLNDLAKKAQQNWFKRPLFIDFSLVDTAAFLVQGEHPLTILQRIISGTICPGFAPILIPVTSLQPSALYLAAMQAVGLGGTGGTDLCLRLTDSDIWNPSLQSDIQQLLAKLGTGQDKIHLVVDLELIDKNAPPDFAAICANIPKLATWRTFTIAGGTFPKDLTTFRPHEEHLHERNEWDIWHDQVVKSLSLPRQPSFGDYAMLHPKFEDQVKSPPSASVRYSTPRHVLIMRGVKPDPSNEGYQQYPAHAKSLCDRPEFCGRTFSYGDNYIAEKADAFVTAPLAVDKPGNPQKWLEATINHHLTLCVDQLAGLRASLSAVGP